MAAPARAVQCRLVGSVPLVRVAAQVIQKRPGRAGIKVSSRLNRLTDAIDRG